ncbi:hypothetical protein MHTCC0001_31840 [Flavobacteriaceae bacterium MHTCC 0001]
MIDLKKIKETFSNRILIPEAFNSFYNWYVEQKKKTDCSFLLGFKWNNDRELISSLFGSTFDDRFGVFASGRDGSLYTFWVDDHGKQKIVYVSSDGGNYFVLGNTYIEFLQYLSIGYSDPGLENFKLTYEQIRERDTIDYSYFTTENLNNYNETYSKPLGNQEGIKELFGENIDDNTLRMLLEINQNAQLSMPNINAKTVEKEKNETVENEKIHTQQLTEFREWLVKRFKVNLPNKGTEIVAVNDTSFERWAIENSL